MRKPKYTHGPFVVDPVLFREIVLASDRGTVVAIVRSGSLTEDPQAESLAKLFAAAPELLDACRYCLKFLRDTRQGSTAGALMAERAIAKYEGKVS